MSGFHGTDYLLLGDSYRNAGHEIAGQVLGTAGMLPGKNDHRDPDGVYRNASVLLITG